MESNRTRMSIAEELKAVAASRDQAIADLCDKEGCTLVEAEALVDGEIEALRQLQWLEGLL